MGTEYMSMTLSCAHDLFEICTQFGGGCYGYQRSQIEELEAQRKGLSRIGWRWKSPALALRLFGKQGKVSLGEYPAYNLAEVRQ